MIFSFVTETQLTIERKNTYFWLRQIACIFKHRNYHFCSWPYIGICRGGNLNTKLFLRLPFFHLSVKGYYARWNKILDYYDLYYSRNITWRALLIFFWMVVYEWIYKCGQWYPWTRIWWRVQQHFTTICTTFYTCLNTRMTVC